MPSVLLGLGLYLVAMLAIGAWVSRRIRNEGDYLVAGRQLGPVLVTASVFATWFGAESIIGASGAIYTNGLAGGSADPFGYGLALVGAALCFAVPLWKRGLTTYADLFRQRYSPAVERAMALIYLPASIIWGAAQVRALGQVIGAASGLDADVAIGAAAAFAIGYTLLGGLMADAITDLVQGCALVVGLVVIWLAVVHGAGGVTASLALVEPGRFQPLASGGRTWLEVIEQWAIPVTGSMLAAEIVQRMIGARSPGVAKWGTLGGAGLYILLGLIPVYLGLVGPTLMPGLADPEHLVPALADRHLGTVAHVLFVGALASISLSTIDSTLLAAGGFVSHNLVAPLLPRLGEGGRLVAARLAVLGFGAIATILALGTDTIYELVETASAFGGSGVFVVSLFALFTRAGGPWSALGGLAAGLGVWAWGDFVAGWTTPYLVSLVASAVTYVAIAMVGSARRRLNDNTGAISRRPS